MCAFTHSAPPIPNQAVAPHAQSKVRVPRGLDLHAQIHEPPPEIPISPSAPPPAEAAGQHDMHAPRSAGGGGYGGCWDGEARRSIEQLGGAVEILSTPGMGTEAFVTLPRGGG